MAKSIDAEQKQINLIGAGTTITGDINCSGDIRIDGNLSGKLNVQGKVVIGTSGNVIGEITCKSSEIEGKVEGEVSVAELLSLKSTSSIIGDIITKKLAIEPGSTFTGSCNMSDNSTASIITNEQKKK